MKHYAPLLAIFALACCLGITTANDLQLAAKVYGCKGELLRGALVRISSCVDDGLTGPAQSASAPPPTATASPSSSSTRRTASSSAGGVPTTSARLRWLVELAAPPTPHWACSTPIGSWCPPATGSAARSAAASPAPPTTPRRPLARPSSTTPP